VQLTKEKKKVEERGGKQGRWKKTTRKNKSRCLKTGKKLRLTIIEGKKGLWRKGKKIETQGGRKEEQAVPS